MPRVKHDYRATTPASSRQVREELRPVELPAASLQPVPRQLRPGSEFNARSYFLTYIYSMTNGCILIRNIKKLSL